MRVVETNNFGGDYPNEKFVTPKISLAQAERIQEKLNKNKDNHSRRWNIVVTNKYKLNPGFQP